MRKNDMERANARADGRRKKRRRRTSSFAFYFFNIVLAAVILVMLLIILSATVFCTRSYTVKGQKVLTGDEVKEYVITGKYKSNGLYQVVKSIIRPRHDIPFVKSYTLSFAKPDEIVIKVKPKELAGYIDTGKKNVYFDSDGNVTEVSKKVVDNVLPVSGLDIDLKKVSEGSPIPVTDKTKSTLLVMIKEFKKYGMQLDSITFKNGRSVDAKSGQIDLSFGTYEYINEKMMRAAKIITKINGRTGTLHMENWTPDSRDIVFDAAE